MLEHDRILSVPSTQINRIEAATEPEHEPLNDSDVPYADKPSRIVLHDDSPKDYLSMLLTEDMASKIRSSGKECRALEQVERLAQDADLEPQAFDEQAPSECSSSVSVKSESTAPSCAELLRRTADEDLTNAKWAYTEAERNFENRHYFYQQELEQCKEYAAGREASVTKTEFDGHLFMEIYQLTRNLIEAEDRLNAARAHAKAFGLSDQWEEMLNGIIDPGSDGYRESEEAAEIVGVDRDRIGKRCQGVSASQELPEFDGCEDVKLEQWDAESIGASDSCCVVD